MPLFAFLRHLNLLSDNFPKGKDIRRHKVLTLVRRLARSRKAVDSFVFDFHGEEADLRKSYGAAAASASFGGDRRSRRKQSRTRRD